MRAVFITLLLAVCQICCGESYRASACGHSLLIHLPLGWSKVTASEQAAFNYGASVIGGATGFTTISSIKRRVGLRTYVMMLMHQKGVSSLDADEDHVDLVGEKLKELCKTELLSSIKRPLVTSEVQLDEFKSAKEWTGMWVSQTTRARNMRVPSTPIVSYAFYGYVLINGHLYFVVSVTDDQLTQTEKERFQGETYQWLREMIAINKRSSNTTDTSKYSEFMEERSAGIVSHALPAKVSIDDPIRLMATMRKQQVDGIGKEIVSGGLSLEFNIPSDFERRESKNPHVAYDARTWLQEKKVMFSLKIRYERLGEGLSRALTRRDTAKDFFIEAVKDDSCVGLGSRKMLGHEALWFTYLTYKSYAKLGLIDRIYCLPIPEKNLAILFEFPVARLGDALPPAQDFERLYPVMNRILESVKIKGLKEGDSLSLSDVLNSFDSSGTGWFISSNHLVTCWHVVEDKKKIRMVSKSGDRIPLKLVMRDELNDLALLRVMDHRHFCQKPLAMNPLEAPIAEKVFTVGYPDPESMGFAPKYTTGTISSLAGYRGDSSNYQISTPVQSGNSGGALIDEQGNVVGVIASVLTSDEEPIQNVNYAVKSKYVQAIAQKAGVKPIPPIAASANYTTKENCQRVMEATVLILAAEE